MPRSLSKLKNIHKIFFINICCCCCLVRAGVFLFNFLKRTGQLNRVKIKIHSYWDENILFEYAHFIILSYTLNFQKKKKPEWNMIQQQTMHVLHVSQFISQKKKQKTYRRRKKNESIECNDVNILWDMSKCDTHWIEFQASTEYLIEKCILFFFFVHSHRFDFMFMPSYELGMEYIGSKKFYT